VLAWLDSEVDVSSWKLACLEWKHHLDIVDIPDIPFVAICCKNSFIQMYGSRISHPHTYMVIYYRYGNLRLVGVV